MMLDVTSDDPSPDFAPSPVSPFYLPTTIMLLPKGSTHHSTMVTSLWQSHLMSFASDMGTSIALLPSSTPTPRPHSFDTGFATWNWIFSWTMKARLTGHACLHRGICPKCSDLRMNFAWRQHFILINCLAYGNTVVLFIS